MKEIKQKKLELAGKDALIVGLDISKRGHYCIGMTKEGIELTRPMYFNNDKEGFEKLTNRIGQIRIMADKKRIVFGFEPTGHYWKNLIYYLASYGYSCVIVNPYHVRRTREMEDNSPTKSDQKDAVLVANLVREGKFSFLNLPTGIYADLRELSSLWYRIKKKYFRATNELTNLLDKYFPEYFRAFEDILNKTSKHIIRRHSLPKDIIELGERRLKKEIKKASGGRIDSSHKAKLIHLLAQKSVGIEEGKEIAKTETKMLIDEILSLEERMETLIKEMKVRLDKIEEAKYLLKIKGLGILTVARFFGEIGDINNYTSPNQIIKLMGLNLFENTSGEKRGKKSIARRGRSALRSIIYRAVICMISKNKGKTKYKNEELGRYYEYLVKERKMERMKAITRICCKLIRIMFAVAKKKEEYDKEKVFSKESPLYKRIAA